MVQILELIKEYFSGETLHIQLVVWGIGLVVYVILRGISNALFNSADKICLEKGIRPYECQYSIEWQLCLNRHNFAENVASCWLGLAAGAVVPMFLFYVNRRIGVVAWIVLAVIVISSMVNRLAFDWLTRYEYRTKYQKGYRYEIPYYPVWEPSAKQTLFFETKDEFTTACEKIYRSIHMPPKVCVDLLRRFKEYPELEVPEDPFHYRFAKVAVYNYKFAEAITNYEEENYYEDYDEYRHDARIPDKN